MELVRLGALIVVNLSGGKDGQAMLLHMICRLQLPVSQMVCIHADLGEAEWEGTEDHARSQAEAFGIPFLVCRAHDKSGNDKALIDYRSEEHTSELQSLMRISYAVFCL